MAHGFSAVKEMYLDAFAEVFAAAGLNALVFDNRNFGASDGEPRQEIDPWAQMRDYRHAITYASTLSEVDAARIGVWGSSYSGGHVLVVGAIDRRVKAVVCQVPLISGRDNVHALVRSDFRAGFRRCSTPTGWPGSTVSRRRWSRWSPRIRWRRPRCRHRTPGSGLPRPRRPARRPSATR
jgi:pimeloyl-ACP methyl ester carboxylesterase